MKTWLFGTYSWQGNPKALMMYMNRYMSDTHDLWWIADNEEVAQEILGLGYQAVSIKSQKAQELFEVADVYVTENFRESYPSMNDKTIILNLWHGVGLKHVELAVKSDSAVSDSIVRKHVRNYELYKNRIKFLVTSKSMENHFIKDMKIDDDQIVRGGYPRNEIYNDPKIRTNNDKFDFLDKYNNVYLFAPTWRLNLSGSFKKLLPDLDSIVSKMKQNNAVFIIKLHPFMLKDPEYLNALEKYKDNENIYFWDDKFDIYEIFNKITVGIIDYSSIFYDLLESGLNKFIRYIPDFNEYIDDSELIGDYLTLTGGKIVNTFDELLKSFDNSLDDIKNKKFLMNYFFEYENNYSITKLIETIDNGKPKEKKYPELHTFDIFDTLIRRDKLAPKSIFHIVQESMIEFKDEPFEEYLIENYPSIRHEIEIDLRDVFRKTTYERNTDMIEVSLNQVLKRLKNNFSLSNKQMRFLYDQEVNAEIKAVQPISTRINKLFELKADGNDVLLVSDMYLPEDVIKKMLDQADLRLRDLPLYLSSTVGHQKSTGRLFKYIFFDIDYHYSKWVHYGDNKKADGTIPRKLGISTYNHDMDEFLANESWYINRSNFKFATDAYKLATLFQRRRWNLLDHKDMMFDKESYYAYSYIGPNLVPYVNWAIRDAIRRGYETLYFISRDGYYLKQIADVIIENQSLPIKSKFIYGSRKAWRVASFIDEVDPASFTNFGMFTSMDSFDDLVHASQLSEEELLEILPELEGYRNEPTLKGNIAEGIRKIFSNSDEYRRRLLQIAAKRRPIVLQYLKQEIDFDEKFAFVEFWGRGYTQDTLGRLLSEASGKKVPNPFYYVRNFTDDVGTSIRHRFTQMPNNFSSFESIFATTPYASIPGYQLNDSGKVIPIFMPQENGFHEIIKNGLTDFTNDYLNLNIKDINRFDRFVGESSYSYFFKHPFDPYITSVFAQFEDNLSMYGNPRAYAPVLTIDDIEGSTIKELRKKTKNIGMSLSRSSSVARKAYEKMQRSEGMTVANIPESKDIFPINDLNNYIKIEKIPFDVVLIKANSFFDSVKWNQDSKNKYRFKKGTIITVTGIDWTNHAIPRLKTKYGYLTAHKNYVSNLRGEYKDIDNYYYKNIKRVVVLRSSFYYSSVNFKQSNQSKLKAKVGDIIDILGVEWTKGGTPRLKTENGYLTSNKKFVTKLRGEHQDIDNYYYKDVKNVVVITPSNYYSSVNFNAHNKSDNKANKGSIIEVLGVEWTKGGTPRLKTKNGYLTANKMNVVKPRGNNGDIKNYYYENIAQIKIKEPTYYYMSVDFKTSERKEITTKRGEIVDVLGVEWTDGGTPRLKTKDGYLTANKKYFARNKFILLIYKMNFLKFKK